MRGTDSASQSQRKASFDPPRPRNSLEPDISTYNCRRSQPNDSEPVSPRFSATNHLGSSNRSNLATTPKSAISSLSIGREYPLNVSDWNEKVQRATRSSSGDVVPRNAADPPRPAREGYEWVWFPEGYWAERERPGPSLKTQKSCKWFRQAKDQQGGPSRSLKGASATKTPPDANLPRIQIGSIASNGNSSQASQTPGDKVVSPSTPGSKIKNGLSYVSPTHPHFTSPTGQPEGLFCKVKRGMGTTVTKPRLYSQDTAAASLTALPSQTALVLEGASSYFDPQQRDQMERNVTNRSLLRSNTPQTPASVDVRPRRIFGLAPWHRKTSQESLLSVSSSIHHLLMGRAPATTPNFERHYEDYVGGRHERVEISEPGQPTFLPSEAGRLKTPPTPGESSPRLQPRGFFFDSTSPGAEGGTSRTSSRPSTGTHSPPRQTPGKGGWWERGEPAARAAAEKALVKNYQPEVDMSLPPEHLPDSPLCPKNPMHRSEGRGICVYHGRRKSIGMGGEPTGEDISSNPKDPYDS